MILQHVHNSVLSGHGHLGVKRTTEKVKKLFHWYKRRTDIHNWIEKYHTCQMNKVSNKSIKAPMVDMCLGAPMVRLSINAIGPLPRTHRGNKFIFLIVMDYLSKWVKILIVPD